MDFSWATISLIDIGLLSFGVVAIASGWIVKRQSDKQYNALQQQFRTFQSTADQRYNTLQERYDILQREHETLQEQHNLLKRECEMLRQENEVLKAENAELRAGLDAVTHEHKTLQAAFDHFRGRYDELTERLIPLFEQLAREKLQGQF